MEAAKQVYVVGVDERPPSILCKSVCKSCMASHRKGYREWGKLSKDVPDPWNSEDDLRWSKGKVQCPGFFERFKFIAERDCKYRLEHIMAGQGVQA